MVDEDGSSDPVDPFYDYSTLSLFPRTFRDPTRFQNSNAPNDLDSLHACLKSMALRSPEKLIEQAKAILDGGSELENKKFPNHVAPEGENEAVAAKDKENIQERRPGLGRKRARFTFKPNISQPTVSLEPSLDIDELQDPEEFFAAYEKLENAKRELQRQRGGLLMELDQEDLPATVRHRRPGILGRKSIVQYKHLYPSMLPSDAEITSSKDISEQNIPPSNNISRQKTTDANVALRERELTGSISKTESKVDELFNELLSSNYEDLDGGRALNLLQERLQIKPVDLDKLCLPDLHDIQKIDFKVSGGNLPKPRNSISNVQIKLSGINSNTPVQQRQEAESSINSIASPTPPKSPFASISLLKRHILQSNTSHDPFAALDKDLSPARDPSPVGRLNKQFDQVDKEEFSFSERLKSILRDEGESTVAKSGSSKVVTDDSIHPSDKFMNENSSILEVCIDDQSKRSCSDLEANIEVSNMDKRITDDNSMKHDQLNGSCGDLEANAEVSNMDDKSIGTPGDLEANIEVTNMDERIIDDYSKEYDSGGPNHSTEKEAGASEQQYLNKDYSNLEDLNSELAEHNAMDGQSENPYTGPEQHIEKNQEASTRSLNDHKQEKAYRSQKLNDSSKVAAHPRKQRKRKEMKRRQSLAAAGTSWTSGVRRSTRIKMRPLEYWKGERFLYGRIHQSLATVIGVKYFSPGEGDEKPAFKVESYVSKEFEELVGLAALH